METTKKFYSRTHKVQFFAEAAVQVSEEEIQQEIDLQFSELYA